MSHVCIIGAGQTVSHWQAADGIDTAPSPTTLRRDAARQALSGRQQVDVIAIVRTTEDSVPTSTYPHGRDANPPGTLARDLGVTATELIYSAVGGQTPQQLVNRLARRIASGEIESALIAGAEAVSAAKTATRAGLTLDWTDDDPADFTDEGAALDWVDMDELRHGLITAAQYYALSERALAHQMGHDRAAHRRFMAELFAPFSEVAAANPHAQYPQAHAAEYLATPSPNNYPVADPYLKWHVAQDAVNQGAAILLARGDETTRKAVWLHAGAEASDAPLSRRPDLAGSHAMQAALKSALSTADQTLSDIHHLDLYSCFPVAVWSAWRALSDQSPDCPLTVTGGLPFFGGPGNNYSLHAIAEMATRLQGSTQTGLVLANGGWMSKESVGLYSGAPVPFAEITAPRMTARTVALCAEDCKGRIETFTFTHHRDGSPATGTLFLRTDDGARALATVTGNTLSQLAQRDDQAIGQSGHITRRNGVGHFEFSD